MTKLLLHSCCAPCLSYPLEYFHQQSGFEISCHWHNPNIQPYKEFQKRLESLKEFCQINKIDLTVEDYDLKGWTKYVYQGIAEDNRQLRCKKCYEMRLIQTAKKAQKLGIKTFSTTLLYSTYQYHETIKEVGEEIAKEFGLEFFYHDFREGWKQGFEIYKPYKGKGLYAQNYCGCIFSEEERFRKVKK